MQLHPLTRRFGTSALILAGAFCTAAAASPLAAPTPVVTATLTSSGPVITGPHTWLPGSARIVCRDEVPTVGGA